MSSRVSADQTNGELTLHTGRQGVGSKVGHDLTIRVSRWTAEASIDGTAVSEIRVVADLTSLEVVRGDGGVKPLSDKDRATILGNAAQTLKAKAHPELVFVAAGPHEVGATAAVSGEVKLAGVTHPQQLDLAVDRRGGGAEVTLTGQLRQSDFGIKPYSGLLGALKVRDMVEIQGKVSFSLT